MKVRNDASFPVIAVLHHQKMGMSQDVLIPPSETREVTISGLIPDSSFQELFLNRRITCHEAKSDDLAYQVLAGRPVNLAMGTALISIRHHIDSPEPFLTKQTKAEAIMVAA